MTSITPPASGITPARAGSTCDDVRKHLCARDHPRTRGEHTLYRKARSRCRGSPPHARGAPPCCNYEYDCAGITPARAGSTEQHVYHLLAIWDHPRTRGEHAKKSLHNALATTFSPEIHSVFKVQCYHLKNTDTIIYRYCFAF